MGGAKVPTAALLQVRLSAERIAGNPYCLHTHTQLLPQELGLFSLP